MFAASLAAIAMFVVPLFGWRWVNSVLCARKNRQIRGRHVYPLLFAGLAVCLVPPLALCLFAGGLTALCGAIAWLVGAGFWFFHH